MATGDNLLTALSVAKECHIIDSKKLIYIADISESKSLK
jgi:cation-transporting P-type ATPase 13A2